MKELKIGDLDEVIPCPNCKKNIKSEITWISDVRSSHDDYSDNVVIVCRECLEEFVLTNVKWTIAFYDEIIPRSKSGI